MVKGIGIDVQSVGRIASMIERFHQEELRLIFTDGELTGSQRSEAAARYLATCFSAKEAMGKALGTGLSGIDWNEIEIEVQQGDNQLVIDLYGKALQRAQYLGSSTWTASWCHWEDQVLVAVIIQ